MRVLKFPSHGETRNLRIITEHGDDVTYKLADGSTAYVGPASSFAYSVCERYCAHCEHWISVKGITGMLRFIANHDGVVGRERHARNRRRSRSDRRELP